MDPHKLEIDVSLQRGDAKAQAERLRADLKAVNDQLHADSEAAAQADADLAGRTAKSKVDAAEKAGKGVKGQLDREVQEFKAATDKKVAANRDATGRFIANSKEAAEAASEVGASGVSGLAALGEGLAGASKQVLSFSAGMVGLQSASAVFGVVLDHVKEVNRAIFEAGEFVTNYRKSLQELSALKGDLGNTTKTLGEDIDFRLKTLQSRDDARAFQAAALGAGESTIDKPGRPGLITPEEARRARELGGGFQASEGSSAATHGTLIGMMPQFLGRRTTGEEVARKEAQLFKIFQPGSAEFGPMTDMYNKLAPLISSKTFDPMQAGALLSAFSTVSKEGAGQMVEQFTRGTIGGLDKTTKSRVEGGTPQGEYYKSIGISDDLVKHTKPEQIAFMIADKIADDLKKQEDAATKKGETFSAEVYLKHQGFANMEDARAIKAYAGLKQTGQLQTFLALASDAELPSLAQAREPVVKAQRVEPVMQARKAELADEASKVAVGAGEAEWRRNIQAVAFGNLKAKGLVTGDYKEEMSNRSNINPTELLFEERHKMELESQRLLFEEAKRVGVKTPAPAAPWESGIYTEKGYVGDKALFDLARKVQAAGGTAVPGLDTIAGAAQRKLAESAEFEGNAFELPPGVEPPRKKKPLRVVLPPALQAMIARPAQKPWASSPGLPLAQRQREAMPREALREFTLDGPRIEPAAPREPRWTPRVPEDLNASLKGMLGWGGAPIPEGMAGKGVEDRIKAAMGDFRLPGKPTLDPYAEFEGADAYPGYSPRGGKIGSMKQVDPDAIPERTDRDILNAIPLSARLQPAKPRGEGWKSFADLRSGKTTDPGFHPEGFDPLPAAPGFVNDWVRSAFETGAPRIKGGATAEPAPASGLAAGGSPDAGATTDLLQKIVDLLSKNLSGGGRGAPPPVLTAPRVQRG